MRTDDEKKTHGRAPGAGGRESVSTPAGSSNSSSSSQIPIRAVIFDVGGVVTGLRYGRLYKYAVYGFDALRRIVTRRKNDVENYIRVYRSTRKFNDGILEIVRELKAAGYSMPVLSNATHENIRAAKEFGAYDHFEPLILSAEVGFEKPDRRIFELAAKRIGLRPEECVFIDDKRRNVEVAKGAGYNAILFRNAKQLRKDLKRHGVVIG